MTTRGESDWDELDLPRGAKPAPSAKAPAPEEPPSPATARTKTGRSSASGSMPAPPRSAPWGAGAGGDLQRLRALTGAPQAVVKIIGYRRGDGGGAAASLRYIGREDSDRDGDPNGPYESGLGEITMETQTGEILHSQEGRNRLLAEWADGFSSRRDGRDVMHLMMSFPASVSPETAGAIAREALPQMVPGRHFAFGVHADTAHAHVHVLVRMRGPDGRQLRTDRAVLAGWREIVAERARARDVALEASPRWARGLSEKRERGWERAMRQRGEVPRTHREAAREVLALLARGEKVDTRFEALMRATAARERAALQGLSWALIAEARSAPTQARGRLLDLAELALARAAALPDPQSRREIMAAIAEARSKEAGGALPGPHEAEAIARAFADRRETRAAARDQDRLSREPLERARDAAAKERYDTRSSSLAQIREPDAEKPTPTNAPAPRRDPAKDQVQAKDLDRARDQDRDRDRD
jgi:hypothetical protein